MSVEAAILAVALGLQLAIATIYLERLVREVGQLADSIERDEPE